MGTAETHPVLGGPSQPSPRFFLSCQDHQEAGRHSPGTSSSGSEKKWDLQHKVKTFEDGGLDA